jgi:hypothetical protein
MEFGEMTIKEDPNRPRHPMVRNETSYTTWILGGVAALAVIFGLAFMFGRDDGTTSTAIGTDRPAATQPASPSPTTGSGTTSPAPANR